MQTRGCRRGVTIVIPKVAVTKVESGLQPLRGDPDNPLKETNAIGQARALRT